MSMDLGYVFLRMGGAIRGFTDGLDRASDSLNELGLQLFLGDAYDASLLEQVDADGVDREFIQRVEEAYEVEI